MNCHEADTVLENHQSLIEDIIGLFESQKEYDRKITRCLEILTESIQRIEKGLHKIAEGIAEHA